MDEYSVKPAAKADPAVLAQLLAQFKIPHGDVVKDDVRIITLGPEAAYEVHFKPGNSRTAKTTILLRYEHPVLKNVLAGWLERSGASAEGDFYTWHQNLSPSVSHGIKARWLVDLAPLGAIPIRFGQFVFVFTFPKNVAAEIAAQLAKVPHRPMAKDEYLKSAEFEVTGDEPFDLELYGWRSEAGSRLFAVTASAPAVTLLSLWVVSEGANVQYNIGEI